MLLFNLIVDYFPIFLQSSRVVLLLFSIRSLQQYIAFNALVCVQWHNHALLQFVKAPNQIESTHSAILALALQRKARVAVDWTSTGCSR
jgi:hypothetical protein